MQQFTKAIYSGNVVELYSYQKGMLSYPIRRKKIKTGYHCRRKDNVKRMVKNFRRLVWRALHKNKDNPIFLTLTFEERLYDVHIAYKKLKTALMRFRYYYPDFQYILVPDFHKDNSIHFHALVWGIPKGVINEQLKIQLQRKITKNYELRSPFEKVYRLGFLEMGKSDGSNKLGFYMSKYMLKYVSRVQTFYNKAYISSRDVACPLLQEWLPMLIHSIEKNDVAFYFTASYDTKYLGKGEYHLLIYD